LIGISELKLDDVEGVAKSRLKLAYGAVRAGVMEGTTRSDMEIESPVATLSKRGTDIFRMEYHNGRFRMELSEQGRGLIQAIQTRSGEFGARMRARSRFVTPGQFITHAIARAIDGMQFDRTVNVTDSFGLQGLDQLFAMQNGGGLGFLVPTGGNLVNFLDSPNPGGLLGSPPGFDPDAQPAGDGLIQPTITPTRAQHAGDFGIGQGDVPGIFAGRRKSADARGQLSAQQQSLSRSTRAMIRR
jgi:hypothetical protein